MRGNGRVLRPKLYPKKFRSITHLLYPEQEKTNHPPPGKQALIGEKMKTLIGIVIIAHGLVHGILAAAPNPDVAEPKPGKFFTAVDRSWLLPKFGLGPEGIQWTGITLVVLYLICLF